MKKVTSRVTLLTAIMGLSLGVAIAAGNVNAAENILDDAIHDYSDDVSRNMQASPSPQGWGSYEIKIVLDEAYHDYDVSDLATFESPEPAPEQAEFAAFEVYSYGLPEVSFTD